MTAHWQDSAACLGLDANLFFAEKGGNCEAVTAKAKAVCVTCPAREACLEEAIATHARGIWGGTTEEERKSIHRARLRARAAARKAAAA